MHLLRHAMVLDCSLPFQLPNYWLCYWEVPHQMPIQRRVHPAPSRLCHDSLLISACACIHCTAGACSWRQHQRLGVTSGASDRASAGAGIALHQGQYAPGLARVSPAACTLNPIRTRTKCWAPSSLLTALPGEQPASWGRSRGCHTLLVSHEGSAGVQGAHIAAGQLRGQDATVSAGGRSPAAPHPWCPPHHSG